jgi:hypothetical protein
LPPVGGFWLCLAHGRGGGDGEADAPRMASTTVVAGARAGARAGGGMGITWAAKVDGRLGRLEQLTLRQDALAASLGERLLELDESARQTSDGLGRLQANATQWAGAGRGRPSDELLAIGGDPSAPTPQRRWAEGRGGVGQQQQPDPLVLMGQLQAMKRATEEMQREHRALKSSLADTQAEAIEQAVKTNNVSAHREGGGSPPPPRACSRVASRHAEKGGSRHESSPCS